MTMILGFANRLTVSKRGASSLMGLVLLKIDAREQCSRSKPVPAVRSVDRDMRRWHTKEIYVGGNRDRCRSTQT